MDPEQLKIEMQRGMHRLAMLVDYQEQHIRQLEERNGIAQTRIAELEKELQAAETRAGE